MIGGGGGSTGGELILSAIIVFVILLPFLVLGAKLLINFVKGIKGIKNGEDRRANLRLMAPVGFIAMGIVAIPVTSVLLAL